MTNMFTVVISVYKRPGLFISSKWALSFFFHSLNHIPVYKLSTLLRTNFQYIYLILIERKRINCVDDPKHLIRCELRVGDRLTVKFG